MSDDEPTDATDEELFSRFRDGDDAALAPLFARHRARLEGFVRGQLPPAVQRRISVSDVVQEACIAAVEGQAGFQDRGAESFRRWIFGIAGHKAKHALRDQAAQKRAVFREVTQGMRAATRDMLGERPTPSQAAMGVELEERIATALETLPPHYREVLRLTRAKGMTMAEAGACLGKSREATKKLFGRAMLAFTRAFEDA